MYPHRVISKITDNMTSKPLNIEEKTMTEETMQESTAIPEISEHRKALFKPLEPITIGQRPSNESLHPPPDFDPTNYPPR